LGPNAAQSPFSGGLEGHRGSRHIGDDNEEGGPDRPGQHGGRPILIHNGFETLPTSSPHGLHGNAAAASHDKDALLTPTVLQESAQGVSLQNSSGLRRRHHPSPPSPGPVVDQSPALLLAEKPGLRVVVVLPDGLGRLPEGRIPRGDLYTGDPRQDGPWDLSTKELLRQFGLDQVADPPLRHGVQDVEGKGRDLPARDLLLSKKRPDLGPIPVRENDLLPLSRQLGDRANGLPHIGPGLRPRSPLTRATDRVTAQGQDNAGHGISGDAEARVPRIYEEGLRDIVDSETSEAVCPLEFRYGRPESRQIFTRESRLRRWLQVEAALALTLEELHVIPSGAGRAIHSAVTEGKVSLARVDELERETRHDVMALTRALAEVSGAGAPYVHRGATSNDILDTALGLELKEALQLLREDLRTLLEALGDLAERHQGTAMVGRTHGQHAVPLSFGYKMATFAAEFLRHQDRLEAMAPRLLVGKMSGAVGTGASFGDRAEEVERRTLDRLGLTPDEAPTQVIGRDRLAEFVSWIAWVGSSCDRLSAEIRNLQRTEIAEVSEPFDEERQVGSSTMAQKRNPVQSENVSSLARYLRTLPGAALENMVLWHERDLANSANERILFSHGVILLDHALRTLIQILRGLRVDADRMKENLALTGGAIMAEQLLLALNERGVPRSEAHEILRTLTREIPRGDTQTLWRRGREDPRLREYLSEEDLERLLRPDAYVEAARRKTAALLSRIRAGSRR